MKARLSLFAMTLDRSARTILILFLAVTAGQAFGQTWTAPEKMVSVNSAQSVYAPSVAVNAAGEVVATASINNQVQVQVQQNGVWSAAAILTTASQPLIVSFAAVAPNGDAVVIWMQGPTGKTYTLQAGQRKGPDRRWCSRTVRTLRPAERDIVGNRQPEHDAL
jgi:hypothetical protein